MEATYNADDLKKFNESMRLDKVKTNSDGSIDMSYVNGRSITLLPLPLPQPPISDTEAPIQKNQTVEGESESYIGNGDIKSSCNQTTNPNVRMPFKTTTKLMLEQPETISNKCQVHDGNTGDVVESDNKTISQYLEKVPCGVKIDGVNPDTYENIRYKIAIGDVLDTLYVTNPRRTSDAADITRIYYNVTIVGVNDSEVFILASHMAHIYNNVSDYKKVTSHMKTISPTPTKCIDEMNVVMYNSVQRTKLHFMYYDLIINTKPTKTYKEFFKK